MTNTDERFESGAPDYAAYLQSVEGRMRLDIAWGNFLSLINETNAAQTGFDARSKRAEETTRVLDLGGGTGALALRFAALGWHASIVDPSATMLSLAADAAREQRLDARVTCHQSAAERVRELFAPQTFDACLCHNVLEYVSDPRAAVHALAALVRAGGMVSLVARNRAGEAMRAALKAHDLGEAERALTANMVNESLYGGPARLFDARSLRELATDAGMNVVAERGVRVVTDYLPASLSGTPETYARLLAFERTLGARPEFAGVARYTQIIARLPDDTATASGRGSS
ncbi:MAG TPA: methyltransferase domain-containing protein [Pyrinomonadaceae bacterium]|nr:methyltransferase domain-containing protein [Pyrinomonadaceae bacterium]